MFAYWTLYLIPALAAVGHRNVPRQVWLLFFIVVTAMIGLVYRVGGDWGSYIGYVARAGQLSLTEILTGQDPGYYLISWLADITVGSVWLVNLIAGAVFTAGLVRFVRRLPDPMTAFTASIPYMVIVLAMGYTRQAMAFGLLLWGLVYLKDSRRVAFVVTIAVAATFHTSAVILLPLAALAAAKNRIWTVFWVGLASLGMYWLFLEEQSERLWENYVVDDYAQASQGGAIRVAMNAVPAFLFLVFRHRFQMPREEHRLWFWISIMSLVCMPLVLQAPTAVDRVALYFMPIQLVVFSHLALLFHPSNRPYMRLGILAGYGLVQFVWLNFAVNAGSWVPYQFWPLVATSA